MSPVGGDNGAGKVSVKIGDRVFELESNSDGIFEMPSESLALADSLSAKVLDTLLSEAGKVSSGEMVGDSSPSPIPEV